MTVVTWRPFSLDDGQMWVEIVWDSPMPDDNGVPQDPRASGLVERVRFQNLTNKRRIMQIGRRTYVANPNSGVTTDNLPRGQRFRLDESPAVAIRGD